MKQHNWLILCITLSLSLGATAQEMDLGEAFSRLNEIRDSLDEADRILKALDLSHAFLIYADGIIDCAIQDLLAVESGLPTLQPKFALIEPNKGMMTVALTSVSMAMRHFESRIKDNRKQEYPLLKSIRDQIDRAKESVAKDATYFKGVPSLLTALAPDMRLLVGALSDEGHLSVRGRAELGFGKDIAVVRLQHVLLIRTQMEQIVLDSGYTNPH